MQYLKKYYFLFLILTFATIILSINLNKPFYGHHDWNAAWYSTFARNFVNYGFLTTKFGSVMSGGPTEPNDFTYFTHYPPMLPVLIGISFKIFGVHEWSARIIPLIFSLWTITMVYILGLRFFGKQVAILAAAISGVLPIVIYFGKMPVQEVLTIAPVLLSVLFYFDFFKKPTTRNLFKLAASLIFSHLINWPGYYVTPLFFIHYILLAPTKNRLPRPKGQGLLFLAQNSLHIRNKFSNFFAQNRLRTAIIFPAISLCMFALHALHLAILTGNPLGGGMIDVLLFRLNLSEKPLDFTTFNFLKQQFFLIIAYFTKPIIFLSSITILWIISNVKKWKKSLQIQLFIILGVFGILHNLIFRNMAFIHDYMIIYLWPFIALSSSFGLFQIVKKFKIKSQSMIAVFCLILFFMMFLQSRNFVSALLGSSGFKDGYDLGILINEETNLYDKVLVLSPEFHRYFDVFVNYYAARNIDFEIPSAEEIKNYNLIIAIPSRDTPQSIIDVLQKEYKATTINQFIVYTTR
ncbi:MAG: glycosyltransferase family 39 protein [Candidatus Curtissbacteria bacterium]|nr:glycosyltransferase family 39 protein [Candidatus Curtissbacteria bacterium]